jgi:hypothetical protein
MSKKLKITEGQLKKLMERKHSYTDNSPEGEVEEQESTGAESAIIKPKEGEMDENQFGENTLSGWEDETESAVKKLSKVTIEHLNNMSDKQKNKMQFEMSHYDDNVYDFIMDQIGNVDGYEIVEFAKNNEDNIGTEAQFVIFAIDDFCNVLGISDDDDEEEYDDQEGSEEDEMMNESIKAIKANFKRFL